MQYWAVYDVYSSIMWLINISPHPVRDITKRIYSSKIKVEIDANSAIAIMKNYPLSHCTENFTVAQSIASSLHLLLRPSLPLSNSLSHTLSHYRTQTQHALFLLSSTRSVQASADRAQKDYEIMERMGRVASLASTSINDRNRPGASHNAQHVLNFTSLYCIVLCRFVSHFPEL